MQYAECLTTCRNSTSSERNIAVSKKKSKIIPVPCYHAVALDSHKRKKKKKKKRTYAKKIHCYVVRLSKTKMQLKTVVQCDSISVSFYAKALIPNPSKLTYEPALISTLVQPK